MASLLGRKTPYTVDAGHFQYETDIAVFGQGDSGGINPRTGRCSIRP